MSSQVLRHGVSYLGLTRHTRLAFVVIGDDELDHRKLSREGRTSETRTLERQRILHRF